MTTTTDTPNMDAALRRIRGLLAKAEGTDNHAEAEAFSAKAFELMDRYRVDLATVRGTPEADIVRSEYVLNGRKYLRAALVLFGAVAKHYGVVVMVPSTGNSKYPAMVGDRDDITATVLMFESLMIQRDRALLAEPVPPGVHTSRYRNSMAYGYAMRISDRLADIRRAAEEAAVATSDSMALAVIDRHGAVLESLGHPRPRNQNRVRLDGDGIDAGRAAADNADLGQTRVGTESTGPRALGA
jgi:hypothetical protein